MSAKPLSDELCQEALNWVELYGSIHFAALATGVPNGTIRHRYDQAQLRGMKPTVKRQEKPVRTHERIGKTILYIPDIQAKPGVPDDHLEWIANYALEKRPDRIVQIGDWADMPSLSSYDKGKRCYEGRRYTKDIDAANRSLDRFEAVIEAHNRTHPEDRYEPAKDLTFGNHEWRIIRATDIQPELHEKLTLDDLDFERRGWRCHNFLEVVEIEGIEFSHYFTSGVKGNPVSSAAALLKERQKPSIMGHNQICDIAIHKKTQNMAIISGCCYLHDEDYLGPQGNNTRRQVIMLHEVENGHFDPMFVSLRFLRKRYS